MKQEKGMEQDYPNLIVMLTFQDRTVQDAAAIFEQCKSSEAEYFGIKEIPLPEEEMKRLFAEMRACGKTTVLEVVDYTEEGGLAGARLAERCGCDILMGTCCHDSILEYCREHHIRYMPFIGQIEGRPSVLRGSAESMAAEAEHYYEKGAFGCDLLGYRFVGDAAALNRTVIQKTNAPVCIAGSVNSYERLDEIIEARAWGFTIGSAFFHHCFGEDFREQIDAVCDYVRRPR